MSRSSQGDKNARIYIYIYIPGLPKKLKRDDATGLAVLLEKDFYDALDADHAEGRESDVEAPAPLAPAGKEPSEEHLVEEAAQENANIMDCLEEKRVDALDEVHHHEEERESEVQAPAPLAPGPLLGRNPQRSTW